MKIKKTLGYSEAVFETYNYLQKRRLMTKMAADIGMPEFFSVGSLVTCRTCSDKVCSACSYYLPRLPSCRFPLYKQKCCSPSPSQHGSQMLSLSLFFIY
jgi:hypothetical protein